MPDESGRDERDGGTGERTPDPGPLGGALSAPLLGAGTGWTTLRGHTGPADPDGATRVGTLRPFSGVLGAWQPTVEGLPLRLSFLSLPWLVRELHTADRTASERTVAEAPRADPTRSGDTTPRNTTVSRLIRSGTDAAVTPSSDHENPTTGPSDDPTVGPVPRTGGRLRDVLRWRPVLLDRPTPTERTGDDPGGSDATVSTEPPAVPRRFRTAHETERADAPRPARTTARTGDGPEPTTDRADARGARETPAGSRSGWPASPPISVDARRPTGGFRPTLLAADVPTVLHRSRYRPPDGDLPGHGRSGSPATALPDDSGAPADGLAPVDGTGLPALTLPGGAAVSPPPTESTASPGSGRGRALIYRHTNYPHAAARAADGRRQDGGPGTGPPAWGDRRPTPPEAVPPVDTPATGRSRPTEGSVPAERPRETGGADTPTSPFASFADSEAVVDHLYREFERRWRIERERRGR